MKYSILAICCLFYTTSLVAQNSTNSDKWNIATYRTLKELNAGDLVPVLIKGDVAQISTYIDRHSGKIKFTAGDVVSATVSKETVIELNKAEFVSRIEIPHQKLQLMNDVMVIRNNVDSAYNGTWPLDQGYDGTGVVIGIIDAPFDINHGDFNDALGNTRIKYVWDQNADDDGTSPDPYEYGIECDSFMIANGTCTHNDYYELNYSHGTGVAGVAGSSGMAANRYRGVAPNSDLILVNISFNENYNTNVTDAIEYIYDKAAAMGKPCVINTSLGGYAGSHDGNDLISQTIGNMISASNGRALVAAAGNAGNVAFHLGYTVTGTEKFTWFKKLSYMNLVFFQMFADEAEFNNVFFSLAATDPATWNTVGETTDLNVLDDFDLAGGAIDSVIVDLPGGGSGIIYAQLVDGVYELDFEITPAVTSYYWKFTTHGDGYFDAWNGESTTGYSNYVTTGLPSVGVYPEIVNYQSPDLSQTLVSSWQCSDKVITVGSYTNRDTLTNYYNEHPPFTYVAGSLFPSSSHGPTRDGRIKPDICATGALVMSSEATVLSDWLISLGAANYMSQDGMHYTYNGTSFSSPVVAGIAALYFQKNPDANYADVRDAINENAHHDAFTGEALPDYSWGYGKADAFRALTGPWGCSADDYTNPPENIHTTTLLAAKAIIAWDLIPNAAGYQVVVQPVGGGPVIKKKTAVNSKMIYGLTANTTYRVNVRAYCAGLGLSNFSTDYYFTTPARMDGDEFIEPVIYPNPATTVIYIDGLNQQSTVQLYDITGNEISTITTDEEFISLPVEFLPNGIYLLAIRDEQNIITKQIVINR